MKKFLSTILVIVMVASLTACGGKDTTKTEAGTTEKAAETTGSNLDASLKIDLSVLKSGDGQPLLLEVETKEVPERPEDPLALPETDALHWYDMEYSGFSADKENLPVSPKDGAIGKSVVVIINGDHPYLTAYGIGAKKVADAYSMDFKLLSPNWDLNVQNQQIDQAINMKPDMIILIPLDAQAATQQLRKINQAGIPVIVSNMLPDAEGMKYSLAWTGPDDWGQFRMLSRALADKMGKKGGIAYITHAPGGSPYFARMMAPITELMTYAPEIKTLDFQSPGFEAAKTKQVVSDWITRFGSDLNAIVCADDSAQALGVAEALKVAGRDDIIVVAAGNSKIGMDQVKSGDIFAVTYQSAEADGATPIKLAADWFNGLELQNVSYLTKHIITAEDVDGFMPAQW
ncbi:MAG: sugar ABC transporter substrate-binding protein [Vallitaleaceae bacterium]|nr:sugar ABC transporter substrate-binding protein [Vallitaleaceae bacterium]